MQKKKKLSTTNINTRQLLISINNNIVTNFHLKNNWFILTIFIYNNQL